MILLRQKTYSKAATKAANKAIRKKLGFNKKAPYKIDPLERFTGEWRYGEAIPGGGDKYVSAKRAARDIEKGKYKGNISLCDSEGISDLITDPKELRRLHDHPSDWNERGLDEHYIISGSLRRQLLKKKI